MAEASSPKGVIDIYRREWQQAIASKEYLPFIFPYAILNYCLLFGYLFYSRARFVESLRYVVFVAIAWLSIDIMARCRTLSLSYGVLVGIMSSWCMIWSATLMICHTPHRDFCRLVSVESHVEQNDATSRKPNGPAQSVRRTKSTCPPGYTWEYMPYPFWQRFTWTLDLMTSIRGLHWSFRSSNIPRTTTFQKSTFKRRPFLATIGIILIVLSLDAMNVIAKTDPYFWGHIPSSETYISIGHNYHVSITFLILMVVNLADFNISYLLCVHVLDPSIVGKYSEPWMHSPAPGPFDAILNDGLRGFWNSWWHQMFRFGFLSPGFYLTDCLGIHRSSVTANALRLLVAFALSGFVHACGCYTQWPATSSPKLFLSFMIQPVGIALQHFITMLLGEDSKSDRLFKPSFMVVWLSLTFGAAGDEYARGGMWLVEPLPFSPLGLLGLGPLAGKGWLWRGMMPYVHRGDRRWESGLAW